MSAIPLVWALVGAAMVVAAVLVWRAPRRWELVLRRVPGWMGPYGTVAFLAVVGTIVLVVALVQLVSGSSTDGASSGGDVGGGGVSPVFFGCGLVALLLAVVQWFVFPRVESVLRRVPGLQGRLSNSIAIGLVGAFAVGVSAIEGIG